MSHQPFEQFVAFADKETGEPRLPITEENFELWKRDYTWDALHGIRYGQSFCNRFGIVDNILYYTKFSTIEDCNNYIRKTYIARS